MRLLTNLTLALGLLLSTATQLRFSGVPVGPGEICLSIAILLMALQRSSQGTVYFTSAFRRLTIFWAVFLTTQCVGYVAAGMIGDRHDTGLVLHDAATYPILISVTLLCAIEPGLQRRLRETSWCLATLGALFCALQAADAFVALGLPGVDPWYWDRLRGWTANPNQFALLCLILTFVSLQLVETSRGAARGVALACALCPIGVGLMAKTNASNLALVAVLGLVGLVKLGVWAGESYRSAPFRAPAAWAVIVVSPLLLVAAAPLASALLAEGAVAQLGRDNSSSTDSEAKIRLELWRNAIDRGLETNMLGLGPGPHLPIPALLLDARWGVPFEPVNVEHPTPGGPPNFESHNSFLELFLQGGVTAVAAFATLCALAVIRAIRAQRHVQALALGGMLLFGSFHVITRHPIVWFMIVACLANEPAPVRERSVRRQWKSLEAARG